jgi:uncharacterized protein YciI
VTEHLLLLYDYVEDAVERRAPHREEHLALVRRYHEDGALVKAGALGDPPHGGALAFRTDDPAVVEGFVAEDPYVRHGVVVGWRIERWRVVT